jgi:outer membrane protein
MKTSFKSMLALAAFGATALFSQAQPAPKVLVIDLGKVFQGHYKTAEQQDALQTVSQKAEQDLGGLNKEINDLIAKYKDGDEQSKNPALTNDARGKAQAETEKIGEAIRAKQTEAQNFVNNTRRSLAERSQNFQNLLVEEISKVASEIAKKKGATLLLNKPAAVYSDPAYDISDEVLAEVNKNKPATTTTPTAAPAPAAKNPVPATTDGAPTVTFPGAKK